ncbi:hypothetical protein [Microcoleus sp. OTE_8_concoct_300]|uniref:hypothetical protein n=1 Tax=Microcoleus sp. OTE_8_concoct_300 TaxID=2964710 RepID=UPI00403F4A99
MIIDSFTPLGRSTLRAIGFMGDRLYERVVLCDRMIVDSFIPLGRSYTGCNFLSVDRLCRRAVLCDQMIIDSLTRKGDRLGWRSNCAIDSGGDSLRDSFARADFCTGLRSGSRSKGRAIVSSHFCVTSLRGYRHAPLSGVRSTRH